MALNKTIFIILGIALFLTIYLYSAYSHIYSENKTLQQIAPNIERKYVLESGTGEKTVKYVALGDSLTYGLGASSYKGTYPYIFAQKFLNQYKRVEVTNLAVSGAVAQDVLGKQLPEAIRQKPDFVTILIGINDVHNFTNKDEFKPTLLAIINELKKHTKAKILVINIPYLGTSDKILPPYNKIIDIKINEFNQVIKDISTESSVDYFDLYKRANRYFEKDTNLYSKDRFHPSDKGYILWGNLISAD